jgi:hypothetical protein
MSESAYYIRQHGSGVQGPFAVERIRGWMAEGRVRGDMELSLDGEQWFPVSALEGLLAAGSESTPAPPAARPPVAAVPEPVAAVPEPATDFVDDASRPPASPPVRRRARVKPPPPPLADERASASSARASAASSWVIPVAAGVALVGTFLPWLTYEGRASSSVSGYGGASASASMEVWGLSLWHGLLVAALSVATIVVYLVSRAPARAGLRKVPLVMLGLAAVFAVLGTFHTPSDASMTGSSSFGRHSAQVSAKAEWSSGIGLWISLAGAALGALFAGVGLRTGLPSRRAARPSGRTRRTGREPKPAIGVVVVVLLVAAAGVGAFFLLKPREPTPEEKARAEAAASAERSRIADAEARAEARRREEAESRRRAAAEETARQSLSAARGVERRARDGSKAPDLSAPIRAFEQVASQHPGTAAAVEAAGHVVALKREQSEMEAAARRAAAEARRKEEAERRAAEAAAAEAAKAREAAEAAKRAAEAKRKRIAELAAALGTALAKGSADGRRHAAELAHLAPEHPALAGVKERLRGLPIEPGTLIPIVNMKNLGFGDQVCEPRVGGIRIHVGRDQAADVEIDPATLTAEATVAEDKAMSLAGDRIVLVEVKREGAELIRSAYLRKKLGKKGPRRSKYDGAVRVLPGRHVAFDADVYRYSPAKKLGPYRRGSSKWGDAFFNARPGDRATNWRCRLLEHTRGTTAVFFCERTGSREAKIGVAVLKGSSLSGPYLGTFKALGQGPDTVPFEVVPYGEGEALLVVTPARGPVAVRIKDDEIEHLAQGAPIPKGLQVGSPTWTDINGDGKLEYLVPVQQGRNEVGLWVLMVEP